MHANATILTAIDELCRELKTHKLAEKSPVIFTSTIPLYHGLIKKHPDLDVENPIKSETGLSHIIIAPHAIKLVLKPETDIFSINKLIELLKQKVPGNEAVPYHSPSLRQFSLFAIAQNNDLSRWIKQNLNEVLPHDLHDEIQRIQIQPHKS